MRLEDCLAKWQETGLLEGLDNTRAEKCAVLLEDVCEEVMNVNPHRPSVNILIPVIRRLANANFFPEAHWLVQDYRLWWQTNQPSQDFSLHTDQEVLLCCKYADECQARYLKR